jgi:transcriptional regulator with XRE-family HTH domain
VTADDGAFIAEVARRVRLHRLYQRMTQEQLGARAGVSRSFISVFETGGHGVDVRALRRIAQGLGVPLASLVAEPEDAGAPWPPRDWTPR